MFENICTLPLASDLFAQAIHPTEPLIAVGLATGHVQTFRLPSLGSSSSPPDSDNDEEDEEASPPAHNGSGTVKELWHTRRHKGSCRCLGFSPDGEVLFSAGTDGIVKVASSATGQVTQKLAIPLNPETNFPDCPCLIHSISPTSLLLAVDSSPLHLFDLRSPHLSKPTLTLKPHADYISSLTPLLSHPTTQFLSTGGSTIAHTDLRKATKPPKHKEGEEGTPGVQESDDQEDELLCSTFVGNFLWVGTSSGVVTIFDPKRKGWVDQSERIYIDRTPGGGESVDSIAFLEEQGLVLAGMGDGTVRCVNGGTKKVVKTWEGRHGEVNGVDGVVALGGVPGGGGRWVSGGGKFVKFWAAVAEGGADSESEDEEEGESESSEEEKRRRKRRKTGKGGAGGKKAVEFKDLD